MTNQPANTSNPENKPEKYELPKAPKSSKAGILARYMLVSTAFAAAVAGFVNLDDGVIKAQNSDPAFVLPTAQKQAEDLGFSNVHFIAFNKAADADKPAQVAFTADKKYPEGTFHYIGLGDCGATSCTDMSITLRTQNPFTPKAPGS